VKLLLDQNRSHRLATMLGSIGYDTVHVSKIGLSSAEDAEILSFAAESGRILVSADTDFGALLALREVTAPSVILFRTRSQRSAEAQFKLLRDLLPLFEQDLAMGSVLVVADDRVRVRRLPLLGN